MNHVKRSRWTLESEPFGQILMAHADYWGGGGGVERQGMTGGVDPNFLLINLHNGNGFIGVKNPWVWFCAEGGHGNDMKHTQIRSEEGAHPSWEQVVQVKAEGLGATNPNPNPNPNSGQG